MAAHEADLDVLRRENNIPDWITKDEKDMTEDERTSFRAKTRAIVDMSEVQALREAVSKFTPKPPRAEAARRRDRNTSAKGWTIVEGDR